VIIKGCAGFGDSIYMNPIIKSLTEQQKYKDINIKVVTKYPEIFKDIDCECIEKSSNIHKNISYVPLKHSNKSQYADMCEQVQINPELKLHYNISVPPVVEMVYLKDAYIVVIAPYKEHIRSDMSLKPDSKYMARLIDKLNVEDIPIIGIGEYFDFHVDYHLKEYLPYDNLFHIIKNAKRCIGQVGFIIPMCEALDTECHAIFSRNYKKSTNQFIKQIKPLKVIHKKELVTSYYD